jgi:hypothetical protein
MNKDKIEKLVKSLELNPSGLDWNLLGGGIHPNRYWFEKLMNLYERGKLEVVPRMMGEYTKLPTEYSLCFRHPKSGLYLLYTGDKSELEGRGFQESLILASPKTLPEHKRTVHDSEIEELERELDLQVE